MVGQIYKNIFVRFSVQMNTLKFAFEIYLPLSNLIQQPIPKLLANPNFHNFFDLLKQDL